MFSQVHYALYSQLLFQCVGLFVLLAFIVPLLFYIYNLYALSNNHLPGPPSRNLLLGNWKDLRENDDGSIFTSWVDKYGRIYRRKALLCRPEIVVADLKGFSHVLKDSYNYVKPDLSRYLLGRLTGGLGILIVEHDEHKKQRRLMNRAFEPAQIRGLTKVFLDKSMELRDAWADTIGDDGTGRVDGMKWLSRMTLDVIGKAGFNYDFNSLQGEPNELNVAYSEVFKSGASQMTLPVLLKILFPVLRLLPESNTAIRRAQRTITRIGKQLVADSKVALSVDAKGARDLLTLLVHSNTSTDLPASQRLSDDGVLAQIPMFLAAGHETTSTATYMGTFCTDWQHQRSN
ncbi:cytochrome p450 [Moniliophthora roreri MCA 2997]|uniref:Cytochrome p450 n=1 Tax=Moniliophthora roreri (strain MCA 2997) TaxID=1381753 RepID=V2WPN6_MONRO|nr:cytochrome p450 [Moniliophthora roreri MCA 2997]